MAGRPIKPRVSDKINEQVKKYFEPQLRRLNLTEEQIISQNLAELNQSLEVINDAIKNSDSFGKLKNKVSASTSLNIIMSDSDYLVEVGILPILLERKKLILNRIKDLSNQEKIENIRGLIKQVPEENIRNKIEKELENLEEESEEIKKEEDDLQKIKEEEELKSLQAKNELDLARVEILERKSKVWRSFLEKESASTILGGILLFIITICQLIAMFTEIEATEIINNSFLLILGYFFGTTVSKIKEGDK